MDYSFIALIASVLISRFIQMSAFKTLTDAEKVKLLSGNIIKLSQITLITTVIMVIVFYFTINAYPQAYKDISIIFFAMILLQRIVAYLITRKNMISNNIPSAYIKRYFLSWLATTAGVVIFVYLMVKNVF